MKFCTDDDPELTGFLALGSNLGDRITRLRDAIRLIDDLPKTKVTDLSSVYETVPVGGEGRYYLNIVLGFSTQLRPVALMKSLLDIESLLGRQRSGKPNEPRIVDIDFLLCKDMVLDHEVLTLPHPRMHTRQFVLEPLCELAPLLKHPKSGVAMKDLLEAAEKTGATRIGPLDEI